VRDAQRTTSCRLLQSPLQTREVPQVSICRPDNHIRRARQDRADRREYHRPILAVPVRVDDDFGPQLERLLQSVGERRRQPTILRVTQDVVSPVRAGDLRRSVGTSIIDDQDFYPVHPVDRPWHVGQDNREVLGLVEAGNLNDDPHSTAASSSSDAGRRRGRFASRPKPSRSRPEPMGS
jgi:hypothetical protein